MKRFTALFCMLCALSISFSACSRKNKMTIGSIIYNAQDEWFKEAIAGMHDAAKAYNVTLLEASSRYDLTTETDLVREQLKKGAQALVVCPITTEESGHTLAEAEKIGIPVITWNTVVTPPTTSQIIVDSAQLGSATGAYLAEYIRLHSLSSLNAALIIDDSFSIGIERCNGFRAAIKPLTESGTIRIVSEVKSNLTEETKVAVTKLLSEHPDIQFIWCWHQMSLLATIDVLKNLGRTDVIVAGTDMSMSLARDMLSQDVQLLAVTTQQPYSMGYEAVKNAVSAAKKEHVEKTVVIPVITYTKDDIPALEEYTKTHAAFIK